RFTGTVIPCWKNISISGYALTDTVNPCWKDARLNFRSVGKPFLVCSRTFTDEGFTYSNKLFRSIISSSSFMQAKVARVVSYKPFSFEFLFFSSMVEKPHKTKNPFTSPLRFVFQVKKLNTCSCYVYILIRLFWFSLSGYLDVIVLQKI